MEALPEGPMPPRWGGMLEEEARLRVEAKIWAARGVRAALGEGNPAPDALAACLVGLEALPAPCGEDAAVRASRGMLGCAAGMEALLTTEGEAAEEGATVARACAEAEAAVEGLQAEAMMQLRAGAEAASAAEGGVITLKVD